MSTSVPRAAEVRGSRVEGWELPLDIFLHADEPESVAYANASRAEQRSLAGSSAVRHARAVAVDERAHTALPDGRAALLAVRASELRLTGVDGEPLTDADPVLLTVGEGDVLAELTDEATTVYCSQLRAGAACGVLGRDAYQLRSWLLDDLHADSASAAVRVHCATPGGVLVWQRTQVVGDRGRCGRTAYAVGSLVARDGASAPVAPPAPLRTTAGTARAARVARAAARPAGAARPACPTAAAPDDRRREPASGPAPRTRARRACGLPRLRRLLVRLRERPRRRGQRAHRRCHLSAGRQSRLRELRHGGARRGAHRGRVAERQRPRRGRGRARALVSHRSRHAVRRTPDARAAQGAAVRQRARGRARRRGPLCACTSGT